MRAFRRLDWVRGVMLGSMVLLSLLLECSVAIPVSDEIDWGAALPTPVNGEGSAAFVHSTSGVHTQAPTSPTYGRASYNTTLALFGHTLSNAAYCDKPHLYDWTCPACKRASALGLLPVLVPRLTAMHPTVDAEVEAVRIA